VRDRQLKQIQITLVPWPRIGSVYDFTILCLPLNDEEPALSDIIG
jgi:hypothetical protein